MGPESGGVKRVWAIAAVCSLAIQLGLGLLALVLAHEGDRLRHLHVGLAAREWGIRDFAIRTVFHPSLGDRDRSGLSP